MGRTIADKVIIITGASSGIGRATALALARERAKLVLVARRGKLLGELEREIAKAGGTAISLALDLRSKQAVPTMIRAVHDQLAASTF